MATATREQLLTRKEAAECLNYCVRKIDYLIAGGELPAVRIGRSIRIRPSSLDLFVEARESQGRAAARKRTARKQEAAGSGNDR